MPFSQVGTLQQGSDSDVDGVITLAISGVGSGNGIIVIVSMLSTTVTVSSVACSGEAALIGTKAIDRITTGSGCTGSKQFFFLDQTTSSGTKTLTITLSAGSSTVEAAAFAVDGPISFVTGSDVIATGSSTSQSVSLGSLPDNALIIASAISGYANGDLSPGAGFTGITLSNWDGNFGGEYDLDAGSAGTKTADMTTAGSGPWAIKAAAFVAAGPTATIEQEGARFGLDDGSESAHTWDAAQDANTSSSVGLTRLIRFLLNGTLDYAATAFTLRYQKNGTGGYVPVPVGASTSYPIPTWQSSATPASGTGAVTWPLPSSFQAGDLLIWIAETANQAVVTPPTGATEVSSSPQGTGTAAGTSATRVTVYAKIATGSETTNSAGDAGDHTLVSSFAIRGAHQTLASALHVVAGDVASSASTSVTCPGGTTTVDNCLIVNIVANATDSATAQGSAWANANLGSVTERLDFGTTSGNGGGLTVITGTLATAGSIGGTTGTLATSSVQGRITLAIRPPATVTNEVYVAPSANIASGGEATTARLTAPSGKSTSDFVTGRRWDDENGTDSIDLTTDDYTEVEWSVGVQSPAADGDYFDFRVYAGSSAFDTYSVTPRWTLGTPVAFNPLLAVRRPLTLFRRH